jgi:cyclin-dependent kinase regulatory subunit CKS1
MNIEYSEKHSDLTFEYRQVILPRELGQHLKDRPLLQEQEWRELGIQQSKGWANYDRHSYEPHILLFRRPLGTDPRTGLVSKSLAMKIQADAERRRQSLFRRLTQRN